MRFPTRRTREDVVRAAGAATYAAVVGDRVLWVATADPEPLVLVPADPDGPEGPGGPGGPGGPAGPDPLAPDVLDDTQPGHHGSRFDLDRLAPGPHRLRTAAGRPVTGPPPGPVAAGATYALTREDDHTLHVVRRPVPPGVTLRAARLDGDRVHLSLSGAGPATLHLIDGDGDRVLAGWPVDPAGQVTLAADDLPEAGALGARTLQLRVDGAPVRRRANHLADPGAGVPLPALHAVGASAPRARLRWSAQATLVLRTPEAPATGASPAGTGPAETAAAGTTG